jgi:hypothetical protein
MNLPRRITFRSPSLSRALICSALLWLNATSPAAESPDKIFEKRILPIFNSPDPSSCTDCHLAGVDLKHYILPSHEKTFLSLRDQGLVDMDNPRGSRILSLISMGDQQQEGAALIREQVRRAEFDAFADWIAASSRDPKLRSAPPLPASERSAPARPNAVIRHARKDRVLESFEQNIWAQRFRCSGCHMPGGSENGKLVEEHGDKVSWIKADAPATMAHLIERGLVDVGQPAKSKLLLKPLNEIKHGGGQKMLPGDLGYKAFRTWLEDYARVITDRYASAAELPSNEGHPRVFGTDIWFNLNNTPAEWGDRLLQVTLFAWDTARNAWEEEPIATTDRMVWGKGRLWQHNLFLLARPGSDRMKSWSESKPSLAAGRYLFKVHVDRSDKLRSDWQHVLGSDDFAGQAVVESTWPEGYGKMTKVNAGTVQRQEHQ